MAERRRRLRRSRGRDPLGLRRALADRLLPGLVAAMALLGAVALGGAEGAAELARRWQGGAGSAVLVQLPADTPAARRDAALAALRALPEVVDAQAMDRERMAALLRPWLGEAPSVPLPVVIELRLASLPASPAALAARVAAAVPGGGASVEAHGVWLARLAALARSLQGVAMAALLLVAGIAAAVVAVAVRAGIASRRQAIAVLHELGATDADIAGRFARRVALLAGAGALAGTAVAVPVLAALAGLAAPLLGGGEAAESLATCPGATCPGRASRCCPPSAPASAGSPRRSRCGAGCGCCRDAPAAAMRPARGVGARGAAGGARPAAGGLPMVPPRRRGARRPIRTLRAEGIAVLTGGAERVRTGLRLLLADEAARLIVSGVHRDATWADLVRGAGLAPELAARVADRVTLGHAAASTRGNARRDRGLGARARHRLRPRGDGGLPHAARPPGAAPRPARRAALLPHPVVPASLRGGPAGPREWRLLVSEYVKLVAAWLGLARPARPRRRTRRDDMAALRPVQRVLLRLQRHLLGAAAALAAAAAALAAGADPPLGRDDHPDAAAALRHPPARDRPRAPARRRAARP